MLLITLALLVGSTFGLDNDRPNPKIYYGDDAEIGEFPFMVSLHYLNDHYCGGVLIEPNAVLTAAHCAVDDYGYPLPPTELQIRVGAHDLSSPDLAGELVNVTGLRVHSEYDGWTIENDIAIIALETAVDVENNPNIGTINLPDREYGFQGVPITVIGWGGTENGESVADILQKHDYTVSDQAECNAVWTERGYPIYPGMICTGEPPLDGHSWFGDSGGPLFTEDNGAPVLVGLTSWGDDNPSDYTYDVNTDVYYYMAWIEESLAQIGMEESLILLGGDGSSHGVVVYTSFGMNGTFCADAMVGQAAMICQYFGYDHGVAVSVANYQRSTKKKNYAFEMPDFLMSNMTCEDITSGGLGSCQYELYPDNMPCFNGDQLAVQCSDIPWNMGITDMTIDVKETSFGYTKGNIECTLVAKKYGASIDMNKDVVVEAYNYLKDADDFQYAGEMKYRKSSNSFRAKIKSSYGITRDCLLCYAWIPGADDFYDLRSECDDLLGYSTEVAKKLHRLSRMNREE